MTECKTMTNEERAEAAAAGVNWAENMQRLYTDNRGLIAQAVQRVCGIGNAITEDMMQEAYFALHNAVQTYNHEKGCTFASYLYKVVFWNTLRSVKKYGYDKADPEIVSLETMTREEIPLIDMIASGENLEADVIERETEKQMAAQLWKEVREVPGAEILIARFKDGMTRKQVAEKLGIPYTEAGYYENKGLQKLKKQAKTKRFKEVLDYYGYAPKKAYRWTYNHYLQTGESCVEFLAMREYERQIASIS